MNRSLISSIGFAVIVSTAIAFAQDSKAPAGAPAAPSTGAAAPSAPGGGMPMMDEHMKKMQALHERMMKASTPEERQKLMDESRKAMQEGMGMMSQMQGGMMGGGMMGGGMKEQKGKAGDTSAQMQLMNRRMDMMQMMMQMMMDQQGMTGPPTTPAAPKK